MEAKVSLAEMFSAVERHGVTYGVYPDMLSGH